MTTKNSKSKTPAKQPTTTKKKAPLAPKSKTVTKAPSKKAMKDSEATTPKTTMPAVAEPTPAKPAISDRATKEQTPTPVTMEESKTEPETVEKAFSSDEMDELKINLEMMPSPESEQTEEAEQSPGGEAPDSEEADEMEPDVISPAQAEKMAKDMFYMGMCGVTKGINARVSKDNPLGPYDAFSLSNHGDAGRAASDQFFDRLSDIPILKGWLLKLSNQKAFIENWGAIMSVGVSAYMMFQKELEHRERVLQALRDGVEAANAQEKETEQPEASNDNDEVAEKAA